MITYSEIYDILRKEKFNDVLQLLPKGFMKDIEIYFSEKKALSERESDIFSDEIKKSKKQTDNAIDMIKELVRRREEKVLKLALISAKIGVNKKDIESMLEHEKELFTLVAEKVENADKEIFSMIHGVQKEKLSNYLIKFNDDTPEFLGNNAETFGPFKKGDIANLPKEISSILVDSKQAIAIEG